MVSAVALVTSSYSTTGASSTVTTQVAILPLFDFAVIVASPALIPFTTPFSTVAISASLVDQVMFLFVAFVGSNVTVSVSVAPTVNVTSSGVTLIALTGITGGTYVPPLAGGSDTIPVPSLLFFTVCPPSTSSPPPAVTPVTFSPTLISVFGVVMLAPLPPCSTLTLSTFPPPVTLVFAPEVEISLTLPSTSIDALAALTEMLSTSESASTVILEFTPVMLADPMEAPVAKTVTLSATISICPTLPSTIMSSDPSST